jgi:hypothetical protein
LAQPNWNGKNAALSDKTARMEFDLTQDEIIDAIRAGDLQYLEAHVHGNPYFRLLRHEVEALVETLRGPGALEDQKLRFKLKSVESLIRSCKSKLTKLEKQKSEISARLNLS